MSGDISLMRLLYNANPVFSRSDFGDLEALKKDLTENGMRLPIVAQPDYLIIDGARRARAAYELGWDWVPIKLTRDFDEVLELVAENNADPAHKPMRWLEMGDFLRLLKPLYNPHRLSRPKDTKSRSNFTAEVANALGLLYTHVEHMGRIHSLLESVKNAPELYTRMQELVASYEPYGSSEPYERIHSVHRMLFDMRTIWRNTGQIGVPTPSPATKSRTRVPARVILPDAPVEPLAPAEQLDRLERITGTLEALAREMAALGEINPLVPAEALAGFSKRLWTPLVAIGTVRTNVRNHIKSQEGQSECQPAK
jgi:hypothetical protein